MAATRGGGPSRTREFTLNAKDYADFAVFAETRSRFRGRMGRWLLPFSVGPVVLVLGLAFGIHPRLSEEVGGLPGLIVTAVLLGGFTLALSRLTRPWIIRFTAYRRFRDGTFDAFAKPQSVEISDDGVRYSGGPGQSLTRWSSMAAIEATPNAIYLFQTSLNAYLLPRRAFTDAADYDGFFDRARELHASNR